MRVFEPSILVGDCLPHHKGEYKHALNSHFSCTDEDAFMFHEGGGSDEEDELYLFSFMSWEDSCSLLELLNMPKVPATHRFDCTTGVVTPISPSSDLYRKGSTERWGSTLVPLDTFHDDDILQIEPDWDNDNDNLCWFCDREECYGECSQL